MTDLDAMEAAARDAHQGEWKATRPDRPDRIFPASGGHQIALGDGALMQEAIANAAHIVATQPARVLPLIEEVRRLRAENARLRAAVTVTWRPGVCGMMTARLGKIHVGNVFVDKEDGGNGWSCVCSAYHPVDAKGYDTEAEARTALETAVSRALGLSK